MIRRMIPFSLLLTAIFCAGCSEETKLSEQDKANLKGAPMPAEARKGMAESMANSAAHPFVHKESDYNNK